MTVLLLSHIAIALLGIVFATAAYIKPSKTKVTASYSLIGGTIASGTVLVIASHSAILKSCVSGLVYLAFVGALAILAQYKLNLQKQKQPTKKDDIPFIHY
ncbi:MAG: hypothetical protein WBP26_02905 [Candidatus Saccharimonadales bacterium]